VLIPKPEGTERRGAVQGIEKARTFFVPDGERFLAKESALGITRSSHDIS